jgi:hypothetical protein
MVLAGVSGAGNRLRIAPRIPGERFALVAPRLRLSGTSHSIAGVVEPSGGGTVALEVALPSGLVGGALSVTVDGATVAFERDGDLVRFDLPLSRDRPTAFSVTGG